MIDISPGRFLFVTFLHPSGMTRKEFAEKIAFSEEELDKFLKNQIVVTFDRAERLAALGLPSDFWLYLSNAFQMHKDFAISRAQDVNS